MGAEIDGRPLYSGDIKPAINKAETVTSKMKSGAKHRELSNDKYYRYFSVESSVKITIFRLFGEPNPFPKKIDYKKFITVIFRRNKRQNT